MALYKISSSRVNNIEADQYAGGTNELGLIWYDEVTGALRLYTGLPGGQIINGGGGGTPAITVEQIPEVVIPTKVEKPITPVPVLAKSTQVTHKVFFGMNASWINSANIKSLKSFIAKISSSNQISQITIDGFTQPTPINPNPLILSKARANSVAKLIKSQGVSAKIIKAGKGNEKVNKPSSRYVLVTVTSTVAG
jgi:outer membrane protein OmpA-like peptidoglycan-associated protein